MGCRTKQVQNIFSEMVDSVATAPCSMTVFHSRAEVLSSSITSGEGMRMLSLPSQGTTNIPAGVEKALRVIHGQEMVTKLRKNVSKTHHILILMSDGQHNAGPTPQNVFPSLKSVFPPDTKLSVVLVGYSRSSNTSMGMLLKESIETVALDPDTVQTIYFATTDNALRSALAGL